MFKVITKIREKITFCQTTTYYIKNDNKENNKIIFKFHFLPISNQLHPHKEHKGD
jgi:hypothetical protein